MRFRIISLLCALALSHLGLGQASADVVVVSEFFGGRIQAFDVNTKVETTLATIAGNPGLSGLAYHQASNTLYASALNHGGIYRLNGQTGAVLGFHALGIGVAGIAVNASGNVYVTDFGSTNVRIYDSTFSNVANPGLIVVPGANPTSGVGFLNNGHTLIATAGGGVYRHDGTNVTLFANNPLASAQITTDALNNTYIGHGLGFSNNAFRYDANGNLTGSIEITSDMVNSTGLGEPGTSPSGLVFDPNGDLFIAVLGRTNPGHAGGERGGLFKFSADGTLLETFAVGSSAYSSAAYIASVPEPSALAMVSLIGLVRLSLRRRSR
ncbi:MAG: hypothetical protein JNL67_09615 [Planctomycetaceae bacterium]|nr:hypothetical protein [Planctomycetaceae bacterium]